jgi:broad specificity phosphatase PhoE
MAGAQHPHSADQQPELFALWRAAPHLVRFPGGESLQELASRAVDGLRLVLDRHPGETTVMVGHDSINPRASTAVARPALVRLLAAHAEPLRDI